MKPDWASIKSDYVETAQTLSEVQAKWGVPRGTLSARATREMWHDEKQQFAARLEQARRENIVAKRAAEQEQFESNVLKVASGQLMIIARQLQEGTVDVGKVLKLANALEKVQRIGCTAFGK
ncbi:MAG: hypothetical protein IPJ08_18410 [Burkholderiales bacterium]|nr:hypothetical protein [Burkholderiales bacterium]